MSNPNYIHRVLDNYCVLDTETTGLSAYYDEIIEIGILKVRDNAVVDQYSQLIRPVNSINGFITALTGITNEMVEDMPNILETENDVKSILGDDVIVGHNTSFDMRFLSKAFGEPLNNKYIDTMQFARKLYPELRHHRLSDLCEYLKLSNNEHRSIADCISTKELYDAIKSKMKTDNIGIKDLWKKENYLYKKIDIAKITPTSFKADKDGFFYGKHVVFTGKLERMIRRDAMQIVVNLGGVLDNSVTKETNYLILGNNDYNAILKGEKSAKHKKAEKLKLEGQDIDILDEFTFYDLLETYQANDDMT